MILLIGQWSSALAAALYGAIALWLVRRNDGNPGNRAMICALFVTALTALIGAMSPPAQEMAALTLGDLTLPQVRHLVWLGFLYLIWRNGTPSERAATVGLLYGVVAALFVALAVMPVMVGQAMLVSDGSKATLLLVALLHVLSIVGALVLVHNLYTSGSAETRAALRMPLIGIAAIWIYDLNLYTIAYLSRGWPSELFTLQGLALSCAAPLFGLSALRNRSLSFRMSRSVAFQSVSLVAIGSYLVAMVLITSALDLLGGEMGRLAQTAFVFAASLAALVLAPSDKFRAWFRVKVLKHLFQHRYDYRSEWLRFTNTIGRPGEDASALNVRVVQAIGDIVEAQAGLLLTRDGSGTLIAQARWNWTLADPPVQAASAALALHLEQTARVLEFDALRDSLETGGDSPELNIVPEWMLAEGQIWALVPLVHFDRLAGAIILTRPVFSRTLDWEDFDLLRVAGRQVASYLAESDTQEALSEARRFDEFNRRFAFIMHDIKNLVSQLTLVTRNAERHADNPEFRADMIETLKSSTARMNALLARLSQHHKSKREEPRLIALSDIVRRVCDAKSSLHPVVVTGDFGLQAIADPARLEQALNHLVQNAIEASPNQEPVTLRLHRHEDSATIDVADHGEGMSAAFIDAKLFKPFTSTKEGGFGIGTFEARTDILEMGGTIRVASREGKGTTFTIMLPALPSQPEILPETLAA